MTDLRKTTFLDLIVAFVVVVFSPPLTIWHYWQLCNATAYPDDCSVDVALPAGQRWWNRRHPLAAVPQKTRLEEVCKLISADLDAGSFGQWDGDYE